MFVSLDHDPGTREQRYFKGKEYDFGSISKTISISIYLATEI